MNAGTNDGIVLNEDRSVEAQLQRAKEERQKKLKKQKRRKMILLGGGIGLVLLVVIIVSVVSAMMKNAPMTVFTVNPTKGDLESVINASGVLESGTVINYYAPAEILVAENALMGDKVSSGDTIILFDADDFAFVLKEVELENKITNNTYQSNLAEHKEAKQKLATARANIKKYQELVLAQQAVVDDLTVKISDTNAINIATLENKIYEAQKDLADYNYYIANASELGLSPEALQTYVKYAAEKEQQISAWTYEINQISGGLNAYNQQKALTEAQNVLSDYKGELEKAKAEVETYEGIVGNQYDADNVVLNGELNTMRTEQAYENVLACEGGVKADFDGVISRCDIAAGSKTVPGGVMLSLSSLDDVRVKFSVTKSSLDEVQLGQKAVVEIMGTEYTGTVTRVNSMATAGTNGSASIDVEITLDQPDDNIYLGLDAKIKLTTASKTGVVMLPVEAVGADKDGEFVYIVAEGIVEKRYVTLGISSDEYVEILEGLTETDQVVSMISSELEVGMPVMAIPAVDSADIEMLMEEME